MIPMWLALKIPREEKKPVNLYLPLIIGWLLILALFVILLPFWLIATLVARANGYGWIGFIMPGLIFNTVWHLRGLMIDVETEDDKIYLKFI